MWHGKCFLCSFPANKTIKKAINPIKKMNQTHPKSILTIASALIALLALVGCGEEDSVNPYMHDMHEGDEPVGEQHNMHTGDVATDGQHNMQMGEMTTGEDSKASTGMAETMDARRITVTATDHAFDPSEIEATPGEKLAIQLTNQGNAGHMWQLKGMPATHIHAKHGQSATQVITVPEEAGDYKIFCGMEGHEEMGMVGTLSVQSE